MKLIPIFAGLAVLGLSQMTHAETLLLSCDLVMDTAARTPNHMDFLVDLDGKTVNGKPAIISYASIDVTSYMDDRSTNRIQISRMNGAISIYSSSLGMLATGVCVVKKEHQF